MQQLLFPGTRLTGPVFAVIKSNELMTELIQWYGYFQCHFYQGFLLIPDILEYTSDNFQVQTDPVDDCGPLQKVESPDIQAISKGRSFFC